MKLLLVSLQSNAYVTGLKYIAANAKANGHDVRILFIPGYLEAELHPAIEKFISDYSPDLIGISLMSIEYYPARNITRLLKKKFNIPIIWGGVHVIIKPDECIKYTDYICTGEGERTVVSLVEHLQSGDINSIPEIPGIWTNRDGEVIRNPAAQPETDLDSLPFQEYLPDYFFAFHNSGIHNLSENEKLFRTYALYGGTCHMMISTRGCSFKCSYCGNSAFMKVYGRKIRERSASSISLRIYDNLLW